MSVTKGVDVWQQQKNMLTFPGAGRFTEINSLSLSPLGLVSVCAGCVSVRLCVCV